MSTTTCLLSLHDEKTIHLATIFGYRSENANTKARGQTQCTVFLLRLQISRRESDRIRSMRRVSDYDGHSHNLDPEMYMAWCRFPYIVPRVVGVAWFMLDEILGALVALSIR